MKDLKFPKKVTHKSASSMMKKLDIIFSKYIRKRDPYCIICGAETQDAGHLINRSKKSIRWDEKNVWGSCKFCNFRHNNWPEYMTNQVLKRISNEDYDLLVKLADREKQFPVDLRTIDFEGLIGLYKTKLKVLESHDGSI